MRYRDLTREQVSFISNGCGGKGWLVAVPDFIFTASCDHHDVNYWIGGTEQDRERADWQFYRAMIDDANTFHWYQRWYYKLLAWTYYKAVRMWAADFFYYGKPRGFIELGNAMRKGNKNG